MTVNYDKLWKLLIDKKISKTQLVHKSGISTNAMAKMGKNQFVRLEVLIRICDILHCRIDDIIDYSMDVETERGRKRRQSPQINSLRQRHIQAFPE